MFKMRIGIRLQLGLLVLISCLVALMVLTLAVWYTNHNFVLDIRAQRLVLTASLKAANVGAALSLVQSSVTAVATRILIQSSLQRYNQQGNNTVQNWSRAITDLQLAMNGAVKSGILMQAKIQAVNDTGSGNNTLLQATGSNLEGVVLLPYYNANGSQVYLGDDSPQGYGYPPHLYPNFTFGASCGSSNPLQACFGGMDLNYNSSLFLGPWSLNSTYSLASLTLPVINNTSRDDILGWMTVIVDAVLVTTPILGQQEGLDQTGISLLIGPNNITNRLPPGVVNASTRAPANLTARFVLAPNNTLHRHDETDNGTLSFDYSQFSAVKKAWTNPPDTWNSAGSLISAKNEQNVGVAVGYATVPNDGLVDWLLLLEQAHSEVWQPIVQLRHVILACVFGTAGAVLLFLIPVAHYSTAPIRRLREATRNSILTTSYDGEESSERSNSGEDGAARALDTQVHKTGILATISKWRRSRNEKTESQKSEEHKRRRFRIPAKVKDREHIIVDELTDLTATFNEMSDELMVQYETLEDRVQRRTAELEESKLAAESANEAKTVFVANISHELKTPLNGILGIAQASQAESSLAVVKRDMKMIFAQGDLLNKLIQDLLLFSKNQVDTSIVLDEGEFRVRDITSQVFSTFQIMAKEREVDFKIIFEGPHDTPTFDSTDRKELGPFGAGRVKDMVLWGDKVRIVQVVNNLANNALKFTPSGGSVRVTVRCLGDPETLSRRGSVLSKQNSLASRHGSIRGSRQQMQTHREGSERSVTPIKHVSTANEINALDHHVQASQAQRTLSPPIGARDCIFEWEVADTGPGMPEHVQEKVFEPFFQGDMALSKKFQGTGLGLSICAQLASLMSGEMHLKSQEGVGSTFTMRVPLKQIGSRTDSSASSQATGSIRFNSPRNSISGDVFRPTDGRFDLGARTSQADDDTRSIRSFSGPASKHSDPRIDVTSSSSTPSPSQSASAANTKDQNGSAGADDSRSLKLLVAEDNKTNQVVVQRLLKMVNVTDVTIAKDGKVAYDMVIENMSRTENFDLIFMDVQMPNMDGLEATRLIREAGYKGPIVALSAYSDEANVKSCHEAGMDDFVSKPIQLPRLKLVLKTFCPAEDAEHR